MSYLTRGQYLRTWENSEDPPDRIVRSQHRRFGHRLHRRMGGYRRMGGSRDAGPGRGYSDRSVRDDDEREAAAGRALPGLFVRVLSDTLPLFCPGPCGRGFFFAAAPIVLWFRA